MKNTAFKEIVRSLSIDAKPRDRRAFHSTNIFTLAQRAREGNLTAAKTERTVLFRMRRFLHRLVRTIGLIRTLARRVL